MNYLDFFSALKSAPPKRVYILFGEESYILEGARSALLRRTLGDALPELNHIILKGKSADAGAVCEAVMGLPLGAEYMSVEVNGAFSGKDTDDASPQKAAQNAMLKAASGVPEGCVLMFVDKQAGALRGAAKKAYEDIGAVICEFSYLGEDEALPYMRRFVRSAGGEASTDTLKFLYNRCGPSLTSLGNELEKLCSASVGSPVTKELIESLSPENTDNRIYRMTDHICRGDAPGALELFSALLFEGSTPGAVLASIEKQYRRMLAVLASPAASPESLCASLCERSSFPMKLAARQAKQLDIRSVRSAVNEAFECDLNIKSGNIDAVRACEAYIIRRSADFLLH